MRKVAIALSCGALLVSSCGQNAGDKSRGAIVLNDSATIVTETDSTYLQDMVADITPPSAVRKALADTAVAAPTATTETTTAPQNTAAATPSPTASPAPAPAQTAVPTGAGLKLTLKELNVFIPGIQTRSFGRQSDNSAAVQLQSGSLDRKKMQATGMQIQVVNQRYTSVVTLRTEKGELELNDLSHTTGWEKLNGSNGMYQIQAGTLTHGNPSAQQIRNAAQRAMSRKRYSHKEQQQVLNDIKGKATIDGRLLSVKLKNIVWQFECKNAAGKSVRKEIRIDVPNN